MANLSPGGTSIPAAFLQLYVCLSILEFGRKFRTESIKICHSKTFWPVIPLTRRQKRMLSRYKKHFRVSADKCKRTFEPC
jgi:hypothetical protein